MKKGFKTLGTDQTIVIISILCQMVLFSFLDNFEKQNLCPLEYSSVYTLILFANLKVMFCRFIEIDRLDIYYID